MLTKAYITRHRGVKGLLCLFLLSFLLLSGQWIQAQCSASISGELAICPGGSRVLTASSAFAYNWNTGATTAAITVNTAGTYTVTTTDATGCTATASATAYILSAGTVTAPAPLVGNIYRVCYGTTLQMSSTVPGGTWKSINNSFPVLTINATTGLVTPTYASFVTDTNTIAYIVSAPGCNVGALKTIEVRGLNPGTMNGNTNICNLPYYGNNTTALTITGGAGGGTWASSNTGAATVNTSGLVTAVNPGSSTISYTVTAEGCANSTAKVVTVNANPSALVTSTPENGCVNQVINISVPDAGPGATYSWSGDIVNQNSNVINSVSAVAAINIYQVTVTSAAGCIQSGFGYHVVNALPVANITANPNPACLGLTLDLSVPTAASTTYAWSGPGINSSTGSSITATPPAAGVNTYTVTAMTNSYYGSCSNTGTVNVTVNNVYPCPTGLNPYNGQTGVSPNIGFLSWDNDNNVAYYRVTFGNNAPSYNNILNNVSITGNNAAIGVLGANQTYGFKVVPVTYGCDPTDCPISTFSTCLPTFNCPANQNVTLNGGCSMVIPDLVSGLMANPGCTALTFTQSPAAGSIVASSHNGTVSVVITPSNPLVAACTVTLTGKDLAAPSITCPANTTVNANASCQSAIGAYSATAVSDNCNPSPTVTQSPAASTFLTGHNSVQTVTLTANDGNGNTAICSLTVTLKDNTAPSITCPANTTVNANASCQSAIGAYSATAVSDNCNPSPTVTQSPAASTLLTGHNSVQTVTLTANDGNGNTATCSLTVTLKDVTGPTVVCKNFTANLNAAGTTSVTTANVFQSGSDNCGAVNQVSVVPSAFTCANLGANTVSLTVNDGHGNTATCSATVTVVDLIAPTMICKNVTVALNANGQVSITSAQVNNGSFDNCTLATLALNRTDFTCADLGQNPVILTGTDQSGNSSSCTSIITVQDLFIPVAKCKNATLNLGANGTVTVPATALNNNSTDNCSMSFAVIPSTLSCANIGNNTVTLKVTDAANNQSTCTAIVTVKDATGPIAICKNPTIFLDETGMATLSVAQVNNGSTDNCGISTISLSKTQFNCSELQGPTWPVFLTLKDGSNNTSTCIGYVTVKDNIAPTAYCENTTVTLASNGKVVVNPAELADNSFDNCSVWSYSPLAKLYTTANIGNNNLTITVKDYSNNTATCVSVVTVLPYNNNNFQGETVMERDEATAPSPIPFYLAPNPTFDMTNLVFELAEEQHYQIKIRDLAGRLCYAQSSLGTAGENQVIIHLQDLNAGMYVVDFECAGQHVHKKLTKVRE